MINQFRVIWLLLFWYIWPAYCTGLLLGNRVLNLLEMDDEYRGRLEATGEDFSVEPTDTRRPFRAVLDVGLIRTATGNHVFGALKVS